MFRTAGLTNRRRIFR